MKPSYKLWFENSKGYVFGKGSYELLKKIEEMGSIRRASIAMKISYRHAWGMIKEIEENLGIKVVSSERGGRDGGKTKLTADGIKLLKEYERYDNVFRYVCKHPYIKPSLTVDAILVEDGKILLIRRKREPYMGMYALPGGFVEYGEKTEDAVIREMKEETGLDIAPIGVVGVYSDPERDPRDHTITIAYIVEKLGGDLKSGDDATDARFFTIDNLPPLAFDHEKIIKDYLTIR